MRHWSRTVLALRALLLLAGAGGLTVAGWGAGFPLVAVAIGALGLIEATLRPGGLGPAVVLGGAATGWVLRYGADPAPVAGTLLLAVALAVHHQAAALAAAVPATARVEGAVPVRFLRHGVVVLVLSAAIAALTLGLSRPAGSAPLELLAVVAVVVVVTVPVLLSRSGPREPGRG